MPTSPQTRKRLWTVAVGLFVVGVLYLTAWAHGRSSVADDRRAAENATAEAITRAEAAEAERDALQVRTQLLEGRRSLSHAAFELERRNFGVAQGHVARAKQFLASVPAAAAVHAELEDVRFLATEDVEAQRTALLERIERLDAALAEELP